MYDYDKCSLATGQDLPRQFRDKGAITDRRKGLQFPHIKPLTEFVDRMQEENPSKVIPYFDPCDGGINAECLFLLEAPGGMARDSNFVSRNNDDQTAKNFHKLNEDAKLPREQTITWNIVPWYLGDGKKIRAANQTDIDTGLPYLGKLMANLPKLRAVVLLGQKAKKAEDFIKRERPNLKIFSCPHPSPMHVNRAKEENYNEILEMFKKVTIFLNPETATDSDNLSRFSRINCAHASRSDEQQQAEKVILHYLNQTYGWQLNSESVSLREIPTCIQLDGIDRKNKVICEIYAHIGRLKGGQPDKVDSDILKLNLAAHYLEKEFGGSWKKVFCFVDEEAGKQWNSESKTWRRLAAQDLGVNVMVVPLSHEVRETLMSAQKRQVR